MLLIKNIVIIILFSFTDSFYQAFWNMEEKAEIILC